jgi:pimeloyl-ACP methyl ester carboxylesterase
MLHHVVLGSGTPILVLHGGRLDHRHMMESLEPVFQSLDGFQRIYVDMPGHGRSAPQDDICSQDDLLGAMMAFTESVLPERRFAIIGESRGSYLARGFAHLRPAQISGVALIVPGGSPAADPARLPVHRIMEPDPSLRPELAGDEIWRFDNFMVVQNREVLEKSRRSKMPALELWDAEQEARVSQAFYFAHDVRGETSVFDGPSLIVAGRQDSMSGYLEAIDLLPQFPRASLAILDSAGHGLAWERPELFDALLRDWLARLSIAVAGGHGTGPTD